MPFLREREGGGRKCLELKMLRDKKKKKTLDWTKEKISTNNRSGETYQKKIRTFPPGKRDPSFPVFRRKEKMAGGRGGRPGRGKTRQVISPTISPSSSPEISSRVFPFLASFSLTLTAISVILS